MKKLCLLMLSMTFISGILTLSPSLVNAGEEFEITYLAPGYTASEFLTLEFPTAAIAFDDEGNLYTSDLREWGTGLVNILKLDAPDYILPQTSYLSYQTSKQVLNGLDFDDVGNLFATECMVSSTDDDSGLIRKIDSDLNVSPPVIFDQFRPTGVAAVGDSTVFFPGRKWTEPNFGNLYKIDSFPEGDAYIISENKVWTGIAIDAFGNIFSANRDKSIRTRDPDTQELFQVAAFNKVVEELNFDWEGNLYALGEGPDNGHSTIIQITPPVRVNIDIKPNSCTNPLNLKSKGVIPVAILGTGDLDVSNIDPGSVILNGVSALRSDIEDVSRPDDAGDCNDYGPDGFDDLVLKFDTQEIVATLGNVEDGEEKPLTLIGMINDETFIRGADIVIILKKGKKKKK